MKPDTIKTKFLKLLGTINVFLTTTFYSAAIALAEGERDNVNTKYFGQDQEFYKNLQLVFGWLTGLSVFVGFIFTAIAMILISKNASIAKMQGNHVGFPVFRPPWLASKIKNKSQLFEAFYNLEK